MNCCNKVFFKKIFCSVIIGFLSCKGLLLQLLCIWEPQKNPSESCKSTGKLFLRRVESTVAGMTQHQFKAGVLSGKLYGMSVGMLKKCHNGFIHNFAVIIMLAGNKPIDSRLISL